MISVTHMSSVLVQCKEKRNTVFPLLPVLKQYDITVYRVSPVVHYKAAIKSLGPGISPGYYEREK